VLAANLNQTRGDEIVVTACDAMEYATRVSIIDPRTWEIRSTFWHFGQPTGALVKTDFFGFGRPAIIVWTCNNKLDGFDHPAPGDDIPVAHYDIVSAVMILDPADMNGLGPPRTRRVDLPPAHVYAYAFLDMARDLTGKRVAEGNDPAGPPSLEEVGLIMDLWEEVYSAHDDSGPLLSVHVKREGMPGELAILAVDRNLNPLDIIDVAERGRQYWRDRWRVIIRDGEYVGLPSAAAEP
jgi:hypothetical protein